MLDRGQLEQLNEDQLRHTEMLAGEYRECILAQSIRSEASDILRICRKYGYGNVMEWASALWRYEERMKGNPTAGCFVPTCPDFIKAKFKHSDITYDKLVASVMEGHACR